MAHGRSEHVAPHDGGADPNGSRRQKVVVDPLITAVYAQHLASAAGGEHPLVQPGAAHPEGVVGTLVEPATYPSSEMAKL
jgi:hypothetical protein